MQDHAQLNSAASFNNTALILATRSAAASKPHKECVLLLLENKAETQRQNADGDTALILATRSAADHGDTDVIQRLLECGADPVALNHQRESALSIAAQSPDFKLATMMWEHAGWDEAVQPDPALLACLVQSGRLDLVKRVPRPEQQTPSWLDEVASQHQ